MKNNENTVVENTMKETLKIMKNSENNKK